jgi:GTP-binding protein
MNKSNQKQEVESETSFGRWLFSQPCTFLRGVKSVDNLDNPSLPEIAFAGRSNCGKSSLLNALTGRKSLARTSKTPGRTQQLNFFDLGEKLWLVDMPGYGYAKASKKDIAEWNQTIHDYLRGRPTLRRLCVLIDSRHGIKPNDLEMMTMLDSSAVNYQIVLTKTDKLSSNALIKCIEVTKQTLKAHPAALPNPIATSSQKGFGIQELRTEIAALANDGHNRLKSNLGSV